MECPICRGCAGINQEFIIRQGRGWKWRAVTSCATEVRTIQVNHGIEIVGQIRGLNIKVARHRKAKCKREI